MGTTIKMSVATKKGETELKRTRVSDKRMDEEADQEIPLSGQP